MRIHLQRLGHLVGDKQDGDLAFELVGGLVALRQVFDVRVDAGHLASQHGTLELCVLGHGHEVLQDGAGEQHALLRDHPGAPLRSAAYYRPGYFCLFRVVSCLQWLQLR